MSDPATRDPMVAKRGVPPKPKLRVRTQMGSRYREIVFDFDDWISYFDVVSYLFKSGKLPVGFALKSAMKGDADYVSKRWLLTWQGVLNRKDLTELGQNLFIRAEAGGEEFEEDRQAREKDEAAYIQRRHEENKIVLPRLNMTAEELYRKLGGEQGHGAYVVASGWPTIKLPVYPPKHTWPPKVDWLSNYVHGYFVWIGDRRWGDPRIYPGTLDPPTELTMQVSPVSLSGETPEADWMAVLWYFEEGYSLFAALNQKHRDNVELAVIWARSFALALTGYSGLGGRGNLGGIVPASRMLSREVKPPPAKFGSILSKIDPIEAAQVGVQAAGMIMMNDINDQQKEKEEEQELQSIGESITQTLHNSVNAIPKPQADRSLRTGELGEAVVKKILEVRGYAVIELQNASGQGIDLVGIKSKGNGLIVYIEVKTSLTDGAPHFSTAQKNPQAFIRDRLERIVAHEGLYKNVPQQKVDIARQLITEIENGRPIGGIHVSITGLSKGPSFMRINFKHWKLSLPRAIVRRQPSEEGRNAPRRSR